jgi:hypothetical protein
LPATLADVQTGPMADEDTVHGKNQKFISSNYFNQKNYWPRTILKAY